ncbi:MAG: hypothetical protein M1370_04450 [Bacteroidetes bacterium]|nr:hypothetical protein [Bacteroidota bacterium]MCL5027195.1 hypothetical protein [Chloroflexota bacterium]
MDRTSSSKSGVTEAGLPWWMSLKVNALPVVVNSGNGVGGYLAGGARLDEAELQEFLATAMPRLKSQLTEANFLEPVVITENEGDILKLRDELRGDVDVLVPLSAGHIIHRGWRHTVPIEVRLGAVGRPIVRLNYMVWDFLALDTVAALKAGGTEAYFADTPAKANEILRIKRVRKALEKTKIAVFETVKSPSWPIGLAVPTNIVDPRLIKDKIGIDATYVPLSRLKEIVESIPETEAQAVASDWVAKATEVSDVFREGETGPKWIAQEARLYLGLKQVVSSLGFTAISGCLGPCMGTPPIFENQCRPCLAFTMLKDEGVPCGCEADQNTMLAMIMLMYLAGKPADMGNTLIPTYTDDHMEDWMVPNPGPDVIAISHAVTPTRMSGFDKPADPYSIRGAHCSWCYGTCGYVELKKGQEVTVARLGPRAERMLIAEGIIDSTHMTVVEGNRNAAYVKVKNRSDFFDKQSEFGNHLTFVYGREGDALGRLCQSFGIEPVFA